MTKFGQSGIIVEVVDLQPPVAHTDSNPRSEETADVNEHVEYQMCIRDRPADDSNEYPEHQIYDAAAGHRRQPANGSHEMDVVPDALSLIHI